MYAARMRVRFVVGCEIVLLGCAAIALAQTGPARAAAPDDYSGMYSFVKEGEFMQITIEDKGKVSGFISRFGDSGTDKGTFIDQFFHSGKSEGKTLSFETENVHGVVFTFEGSFDRGPAKKPEEEGYFVLRGTLNRSRKDADGKVITQPRQVEFRSFPRDTSPAQ